MDSILSVQNKDFTGDWEVLTNVRRAVKKSRKSFTLTKFIGIWQILWRFIMESSNFDTSSIRDKWHRWKSGTQIKKKRNVCCTVAIGLGWKVVGRSYGVLLLSAKCPRPPGRWENSVWKTIWRTIRRTLILCGAMVENYPISERTSIKTSSSWQDKFYQESFLGVHWSRRDLERRHSDCGSGRFGKVGRIRN